MKPLGKKNVNQSNCSLTAIALGRASKTRNKVCVNISHNKLTFYLQLYCENTKHNTERLKIKVAAADSLWLVLVRVEAIC